MNKALIGIIALGVGFGAGFVTAQRILKATYVKIAQEEIDSVNAMWKRREQKEENARVYKEELERVTEKQKQDEARSDSSLVRNKYEQTKTAYHLVGRDIGDEDLDRAQREAAETETRTEEMNLTDIDRTKPYLITDIEYSEEFDHHDKVSLYFYRADGVLCEESEEMVDDIDGLVTDSAVDLLDSGEADVVWVRNEPLGIDYEICAVPGSYSEHLGIATEPNMSPREQYAERQRRRMREDE